MVPRRYSSRLALLLAAALTAAAAPAVRSDLLVSTDWLAHHLSDRSVVILQVSRDRAAYDAGHIPGARFIALSDLIMTREGILNELRPAADLTKVFEQAGVSDDSRAILYTEGTVLPATRAYFTLDYLGHGDRAALLDGGLQKWKAESRPLSKQAPAVRPGRFTARLRPEIVVGLEAVKDLSWAADSKQPLAATLLDVRSAEEFKGDKAASEISRPGHIPGALNVNWTGGQASRESTALKPETALRQLYESAGVTPDRPVVTYCNTGMQATQSYFTLKYLGYDVKMYDGSFSEWSNLKGTPVAK
jgi:thiosulfate/3-mercaptopyruvate sulfurtransferase